MNVYIFLPRYLEMAPLFVTLSKKIKRRIRTGLIPSLHWAKCSSKWLFTSLVITNKIQNSSLHFHWNYLFILYFIWSKNIKIFIIFVKITLSIITRTTVTYMIIYFISWPICGILFYPVCTCTFCICFLLYLESVFLITEVTYIFKLSEKLEIQIACTTEKYYVRKEIIRTKYIFPIIHYL